MIDDSNIDGVVSDFKNEINAIVAGVVYFSLIYLISIVYLIIRSRTLLLSIFAVGVVELILFDSSSYDSTVVLF